MKQLGMVALVVSLLVACGSSSAGLVSQVVEGGPGQPITVDITGAENQTFPDREGWRQYELHVEVSNLSDVPQTVTRISITSEGSGAFQVQSASQKFNEMIDPGRDHEFPLFVTGRLAHPFGITERRVVLLRVIVALANGDQYYYTFEGPVREM